MEQQIINYLNNISHAYIDINNEHSIEKIYNLLINDIMFEAENIIENHYLGWYYGNVTKNYDLMKEQYNFCIDNGYIISTYNLGHYYQNIEQNYDLMKKYYLMAIDFEIIQSMHQLAYYYQYIEKNYDLMAIDKDSTDSLILLRNHYNNESSIEKLEFFIKYINKIERKTIIDTIIRIAKIKLNKEDKKKFVDIIINFKFEDKDNIPPIVKILVETIKNKINFIKLHFEYSLGGEGFREAKNHFYDKVI
jgi:hypothetical protein